MSICTQWVLCSALVLLFPSVAADTTTRGLLSVRRMTDSVTGAPRLLGTTAASPTHGWEPDGTWNGKKVAGAGKGDQKSAADFVVTKKEPQGPNLGQAPPSATGFQTSDSEDATPMVIGGIAGGLVIMLGLGLCIFMKCVRANLDPVSPGEADIGVESYTTGVTHWANTSDKPAPESIFHKPHHMKGEGAVVDGADLKPSLSGLSHVSGAPLTYDPHSAPSHESGRTLHSASVENSKHHAPQGEHAPHKAHSPGNSPRNSLNQQHSMDHKATRDSKGSRSPGQSPRAVHSHHSPRHSLPTPGVGTVHPTHNEPHTGVGHVHTEPHHAHHAHGVEHHHSLPTPGVGTVHPTHNAAADHHAAAHQHSTHSAHSHHSKGHPESGHQDHQAAQGPSDSLRSAGHGDAHGAHPHHKPTLS